MVVPPHLSLESAATLREAETALPMLELIDQLASRAGVPVDSRMERGRSHRQALASIVERERFDTLAVPTGVLRCRRGGVAVRARPGGGAGAGAGTRRQGATPVRRDQLTALRSAARLAGWFFSANSGFSDADW